MAREMKDSGVEWIGKIPKDWKIKKMKTCTNIIMGQSPDSNDILSNGKIPFMQGNREFGKRYPHPSLYCDSCKKYSRIGDILLSVRAPIGAINESDKVYGIGRGLCAIKADTIENSFLKYYLMKSIDDLKYYSNGSTFEAITINVLQNFYIILPDDAEQQKIADFLDKKCVEFDNILEKTHASIEEYKKLKQAVITQAVTKGIRDDREMKDSQSTWFGQIPSDWNMRKIKYIFKIQKDIAGEEGYTVLSITQKGIKPKDLSKNEGQLAGNYSNYQLVHIGDFAMNHMDLLTGWVDVSQYEGVTSPDYRVFRLTDKDSYCSKYYLYLMQLCYTNRIFYGLGQGVSGLGRWRLQVDKFLNFSIIVPSYEEQKEIANYLDQKCSAIDELIAKKEQYLSEIENYKISLIYEYVTGKKEVPQKYQA